MRLFAGIELPPDVQRKCADVAERLRRSQLDARYESPEKMHITLAFLGNVESDRVPSIEAAIAAAAESCDAFDVTLDRVGAFPNERRPRIVWIGTRAQGRAYRELAAATRGSLLPLGFTFDDDAIAHVTIARIKGGGTRPVPMLDLAPISLRVVSVALFESLPGEGTTRYEIRARVALRS